MGEEVTAKMIEDIVSFLKDSRLQMRAAAANATLAASATPGGAQVLHENGATPWLCRLIGDDPSAAKDAVTTLINMGADLPPCMEAMAERGVVTRVMECIDDPTLPGELKNLYFLLLANLTTTEAGLHKLLQLPEEEDDDSGSSTKKQQQQQQQQQQQGQYLQRLVRAFVRNPPPAPLSLNLGGSSAEGQEGEQQEGEGEEEGEEGGGAAPPLDPFQHLASVICNATASVEARQLIKQADKRILEQLLPELLSPSLVRRRGVSGAVRNCCFDQDDLARLLSKSVNLVTAVLLPLTDDSYTFEFDEKVKMDPLLWKKGKAVRLGYAGQPKRPRKREPDPQVRTNLMETILRICATNKACREVLRAQGVYYVVRETDQRELDEDVGLVNYNVVNFLQRDEEAEKKERIKMLTEINEEEGVGVGGEHKVTVTQEGVRAAAAAAAAAAAGGGGGGGGGGSAAPPPPAVGDTAALASGTAAAAATTTTTTTTTSPPPPPAATAAASAPVPAPAGGEDREEPRKEVKDITDVELVSLLDDEDTKEEEVGEMTKSERISKQQQEGKGLTSSK